MLLRITRLMSRLNKSIQKVGYPLSGLKISKNTVYAALGNIIGAATLYIEIDHYSLDIVYDFFALVLDLRFMATQFLEAQGLFVGTAHVFTLAGPQAKYDELTIFKVGPMQYARLLKDTTPISFNRKPSSPQISIDFPINQFSPVVTHVMRNAKTKRGYGFTPPPATFALSIVNSELCETHWNLNLGMSK